MRETNPSTPLWPPPAGFVPMPSRIGGIELYGPAPRDRPDEQTRSYRCSACGGVIAYSALQRRLTCPYCSHTQDIDADEVGEKADEFEFTLAAMKRAQYGWGNACRELVCESCGSAVAISPDALTSICAFCGSNRVHARDVAGDMLRPSALIPFEVDEAQCPTAVADWLGRGWMHPSGLSRVRNLRELTGVYLPFWTFDAHMSAGWRAEIGTPKSERYRSGGEWKTRTVVDWRWRSGQVHLSVDDQLIAGTSRVSQVVLNKVLPFDLSGLQEYEPAYLAGWQAKGYDVELREAWETGRERMREQAKRACYADTGSSHVRNFRMSIDFADERWRYLLLPIYLASYPLDDRTFQVMLNGQTGKIAGQKPVDWRKVWLVIAALLAPGAGLGLLGLLTLPLAGVGFIGLVLGFILFIAGLVGAVFVFKQARSSEEV